MASDLVKFQTDTGEVQLSPSIVRNYITQNPKTTDAEIYMFIELCKYRRLNPLLREAFLVKYGDAPAQQIVAAIAMNKIAKANPNYRGEKSGITVTNGAGQIERRRGTLLLDGEVLIGAWCEVYVNGYAEPIFAEVSMKEYSKGQSTWKTMPAVMLHKTACATAWRSAFPNDFAGMYVAEEMPVDVAKLPTKAIEVTDITDEPEYITDEQYAVLQSIWGSDKAKQIQAVKVFDKYGIPQKHPKFQKQYRAITVGIFDEIHSEILMMTEGARAEVVHPVIEIEPVVEDELPDSYKPEQVEDEKPYADYVPYSGKHKYASKRLDEIPHWFLEQVANTAVADDNWKKRNTEIKEKVLAFLGKSSYNEDEPTINPPFDLD